jgi:hypothetical protein
MLAANLRKADSISWILQAFRSERYVFDLFETAPYGFAKKIVAGFSGALRSLLDQARKLIGDFNGDHKDFRI